MAGWGGSSPQRGRAFADAGRDALAIVAHLGLEGRPLHLVGVSFGAGNAAAMAALRPQRVASLSLIIPAWPSMPGHDMWRSAPLLHRLTAWPLLDRLWQYYVAPQLDIPTLLKSLAPRDWAEFESKMPNAVTGMSRELRRSTKYHMEGACDGMRLLRQGGRALAGERQALRSLGRRVAVWWAEADQLAPAHHGEFLARWLPEARAFPQPGGHLGMFTRLEPFLDAALDTAPVQPA
jgi:pimeloyl-ACP methyl ester carboxylesterase